MTLQFKFPSSQTNLLALEGTLYKIKIFYDEESAARNQDLNTQALADIISDELEEAVRVLCLMFMKGSELKRVKSCHFIFIPVRKPWKTAKKLKFKCNGETLNACPDLLEVTVSTRVTPSALFNCNHRRVLIDNSSASLMNDSAEAEQTEQPDKNKKSSPSPPKRKRSAKDTSGSSSKKRKNKNSNNSVISEDEDLHPHSSGPQTRSFKQSLSTNESERMDFCIEEEENQFVPPTNIRYHLRNSGDASNSNNNSQQPSGKVQAGSYAINSTAEDKSHSVDAHSRNLRSRRPLLKKSPLDQFVVEDEERAEELKLQQLTQPSKSPTRSTHLAKGRVSPRRPPVRRSSLIGTAVDMILTPFKYFTRNRSTVKS